MGLVRPPALRPGARVAAVSLSWGGPGALPHRYEAGVRQLERALDVEVVDMPSTRAPDEELDADPRRRVDDLHAAFADPDVDAVVSSIGGDDSIRLLPLLDLELLRANPKPFLGYSDATITHLALLRAGMVSYYGPAVMAGFAENGGMHEHTLAGVRAVLVDGTTPPPWPEHTGGWTVEHLDWSDPTNQDRPRTLRPTTGWRWHGGAAATGPVVGGCLEVLDLVRGTPWWPDLAGCVLLLETSEEAPPPSRLTYLLRTLAVTGELASLAGVVLGRPGGAELDDEQRRAYDDALLRVVRREEGLDELPVVTNVDVGHTDPMWTVPLGVPLRLDPDAGTLGFTEPSVAAPTTVR